MIKALKVVSTAGAVLALSACGSMGSSSGPKYEPANVTWTKNKNIPFTPASKSDLPANTANLVFFREADSMNEQSAVNIGINDRYQASLRGGNYTAIPSCAGDTKISTAITRRKINDMQFNPNLHDLQPAENYYFNVTVDSMGNSKANRVSEEEALQKLAGKNLQTHTISRVVQKNCAVYEKRAPDPVPVEDLKLFGVYYYDFDIPTMNAQERQRAFNFGKKILDTGKDYEVYLSGHADPMGTDPYNKALSRKRSIDVAKVLEQSGVDPSKIKVGSFGESQPVVLTCNGIKVRNTRNSCNLKNRRVEALVKLK